MLHRNILAVTLLATSSLALAEDSTTITVGPSASVSVQSNGNTASATAGSVVIKQSGTGSSKVEVKNLQTTQGGSVSASAVVVNGGKEGDANAQVEVTKEGEVKVIRTDKEGQVSTIVVGDDHKSIKVDSTSTGTTIEVK